MRSAVSDGELVRAATADNEQAFSELAARYRSAAFGVAFSRLNDFEAARDAAQDALVRAYLELRTLRDPSKFAGWFYQIALRTALAAGRRQRSVSSIDEPSFAELQGAEPDPQEALQRSERAGSVRDALAELADTERITLILHYVDGYSHQEIGSLTGASVPSVKSRLYRARRRLKQEMLEMVETNLQDERSPELVDRGVMVEWFGLPPLSLCSNYLLGGDEGKHKAPSFERAMVMAERFARWKNERALTDFSVDIITGYPNRLPEFAEALAFNRKHGATGHMFMANGGEMMTEEQLRQVLPELKACDPQGVWLTFYGSRERHDRTVSRPGDFDQLMLIARLAGEYGLERYEEIPLWKSVIDDLSELAGQLDTLPGLFAQRHIFLPDYRGQAKRNEVERPTADDIDRIPERLRQYVRNGGSKPHKAESEWVERFTSGDSPKKTTRYYIIPVWEDNIDWLESSDCDKILQDIREQDDRTYQAIPSLPTLAELYGKKNGRKLYWGRDLEWKWIDAHLKAHPEIDPAGKFDDLRPTILWR